jgi:urease subunit gamma/beta
MMLLSEAERDRLLVFTTAELARARRRRGLRLNVVEATALVADAVLGCPACAAGCRCAGPGGWTVAR